MRSLTCCAAAVLMLTAAAGCNSLPDGNPPAGSIVDNQPPGAAEGNGWSYAAARNRIADALTFALLTEKGPIRVRIAAPPVMRPLLRDALESIRDVCPVKYDAGGGYSLTGEDVGARWSYRLKRLNDGKILCSGEFEAPERLILP
ncbi:MAG: hypothetical protein PHI35_07395 [Victivallaceae bacterium]|nr:hypothetical protein [Victivallaceae bacterium]